MKSELESLYSEVGETTTSKLGLEVLQLGEFDYITGETTQQIYESCFNGKLAFRPSSGRRFEMPDTWVETNPAKVPESLQDKIKYIQLQAQYHPCGGGQNE